MEGTIGAHEEKRGKDTQGFGEEEGARVAKEPGN